MGPTLNLILSTVANILLCTQNPRFILSIRVLYAQNVHSEGIDTGFGMLSRHGTGTVTNIGTAMHFADLPAEEGLDEVEEIPMEEQRT